MAQESGLYRKQINKYVIHNFASHILGLCRTCTCRLNMELPLVNTVNAICFAPLVSADNNCLTIDAILSLSQVHNTFITITNGLNKLNLF